MAVPKKKTTKISTKQWMTYSAKSLRPSTLTDKYGKSFRYGCELNKKQEFFYYLSKIDYKRHSVDWDVQWLYTNAV